MKSLSFFKKIYLSLVSLILVFSWSDVNASHITGADISYSCLGNNDYEITLTVIRDCYGIALSDSAIIDLAAPSCGLSYSTYLYKTNVQTSNVYCPSAVTACSSPSGVLDWEIYTYKDTVTLASCSDWEISWTSCCRSFAITTLANPGTEGFYVNAFLDATLSTCNSSPKFDTEPASMIVGINKMSILDFSATDFDGDSLAYSLIPARSWLNSFALYSFGLSGQTPIISSYINLNTSTGFFSVTPTTAQIGVVAVKVEEYRNGQKIGEITRDMQVAIVDTSSSNSSPIISSINGSTLSSNIIPITTTVGDPVNLNINVHDAEVAAGTQILTAIWDNMPFGVLASGGSSPSFSWTPTSADTGTNYIYLTLMDNNCPLIGSNTYTFEITVQDTNAAPIAVNDTFYITKLEPIVLNLTLNDLDINGDHLVLDTIITYYNSNISNVYIQSDSTVEYFPTVGFNVIDSFRYRVCDNQSPSLCSEATVYFKIPTTIYHQAAAGASTTIWLDSTGLGNPMESIIHLDLLNNATFPMSNFSIPAINLTADSIAIDTVTVLICDSLFIGANTTCIYNVVILDVQQGVWPGDTDTSQMVNHYDLLNIGYAFGNTGSPRNPASIVWDGYLTPDWTKVMPVSNINFKHIDCNGDGIINVQDTVAIATNWNKNYTYRKNGSGTIPFYLDSLTSSSYNASLPINLGTSAIPANDIYGLAFTITYDTALIVPNTIDISIDTSWLGTAGTDLISIHKDFYNDGMVQVAITRTDGFDKDGFGIIGSLDFTIQDDIMLRGAAPVFVFDIVGVKVIDEQENPIFVNPQSTSLPLFTVNTETQYFNHLVKVFPNPANNFLNIQSSDLVIEQVILTNVAGQVVKNEFINTNQVKLSTFDLPSGIYTLSIHTDKGLMHQKVSILK